MVTKFLAAAVVTTALMTGGAWAQNNSSSNPSAATTATTASQSHQEGEWRASKLAGVNVYNENGDKIGDINDVILDKSGKANLVVLGVGGFLGMGEHYVAVPFEKLKWSNEPVRASTASNSSGTAPATNVDSNSRTASENTRATTGNATTSNTRSEDKWYPDHAVLNATKDQLKSMPQFKY